MKQSTLQNNEWAPCGIDVDEIVETAEDFVRVIVSKTGQPATIKRRHILDVFSGRFYVPLWLARILLNPETEKGQNHETD